jgi:hypothetical protein
MPATAGVYVSVAFEAGDKSAPPAASDGDNSCFFVRIYAIDPWRTLDSPANLAGIPIHF